MVWFSDIEEAITALTAKGGRFPLPIRSKARAVAKSSAKIHRETQ